VSIGVVEEDKEAKGGLGGDINVVVLQVEGWDLIMY